MAHVHVASVDQLTYDEFIRSLNTPTTLAVINMNPLNGYAIMEIDPAITFLIIDRIFGGIGDGTKSQHELTDIEKSIMENIIIRMLGNLREAWTTVLDLRPLNPGYCYLRLGDRRVWLCQILPDCKWFSKRIKIVNYAEKPFGTEGNDMKIEEGNSPAADALSCAMMKISVELGATLKTVKEVFAMNEGTILELDKLAGEPVDVKANGVLIAYGEVVVIDENFGVRITEIMGTSDVSVQRVFFALEPPESTAGDAATEQNTDTIDEKKFSDTEKQSKGEDKKEGRPFDYIKGYNPKDLLNLIQNEHPQVIALVLAHLEPVKASVILQNLFPMNCRAIYPGVLLLWIGSALI